MSSHRAFIVLALFLATEACATVAPPLELFGATQAALRLASELGASDVPTARWYQKLANEERDQAKNLISTGKHAEAALLLRRAIADAELSVVLTRQARALQDAEEVETKTQAMRELGAR